MAAASTTATMSAVSAWYRNQSRFFASRRQNNNDIEAQQPRTTQGQQPTGDAVINMAQLIINNNDQSSSGSKEKKKQDTLFGPNIGIVSGGPEWTERSDKPLDELTPEIVKSWIAKSKETNHSTTTLQALVNLKRPTLRLSPLELSPSDDPNHIDSQHHHGLEFEYDCDSPKCGIYVHVVLSPSHHLADKSLSISNKPTKFLVFDTVTQGGFGKILKLEEGAMLELGRFDHRSDPPPPQQQSISSSSSTAPGLSGLDRTSSGSNEDPASSSTPPHESSPTPVPVDNAATAATTGDVTSALPTQRHKKRFTSFHFRRRTVDRNVAGPALAVVDAESNVTGASPPGLGGEGGENNHDEKKIGGGGKDEDVGVKVTIKLAALDEEGRELESVNEQTTYLHIVRFGAPPPPAQVEGEVEEDKRPWVVKVVKREATIGPHTFHLHEIYGLSSNSTTATHAVAPTTPSPAVETPSSPAPTHSYPPTSSPPLPLAHQQQQPQEEEPSSECLLCLSSPREVVLLPCRHLVACRECAINMIEFGAGGTIVHSEPDPPAGEGATTNAGGGTTAEGEGDAAAQGQDGNGGEQAAQVAAAAVVATPPRRKRKAKGWFCPVCRQPYTSLLRITTTPPLKDMGTDDETKESSDGGEEPSPGDNEPNSPGGTVVDEGGANGTTGRRPGFLRAFSRTPVGGDVERGGV